MSQESSTRPQTNTMSQESSTCPQTNTMSQESSARPQSVKGQVLIFRDQWRVLKVVLLHRDVPLEQVWSQRPGLEFIDKPCECELVHGQFYTLECPDADAVALSRKQFNMDDTDCSSTFKLSPFSERCFVSITVREELTSKVVWRTNLDMTGDMWMSRKRPRDSGSSKMSEIRHDKTTSYFKSKLRETTNQLEEEFSAGSTSMSVEEEPQPGPSNSMKETVFTPKVFKDVTHLSYWFKCPSSGTFRCDSTGLMFVVTKEAELQYRIVQWDEALLKSSGKTPAGPLYDIECSENAVCELHLPHCEPENSDLSQSQLSVAHISDSGLSLIQPQRITQSHVVIPVSGLSFFGLLWQWITGQWPVKGKVLLFRSARGQRKHVQINIHLLLYNIPLTEVIKKQRVTGELIDAPPQCELTLGQYYCVNCNCAEVQPQRSLFQTHNDPDYSPHFQLRLPPDSKTVSIALIDESSSEVVWECMWDPNAGSTSKSVEEEPQPGPSDLMKETVFTPKVFKKLTHLSYWFKCPSSGTFRCDSTGLVFVVTKEAELQYRIVQWKEALLQSSGKTPAGPLYNIECSENAVCELHLPHCEPENSDLSRSQLSVAHINDSGLSLIQPQRITQSHVVIPVSDLSDFGLMRWYRHVRERLWKWITGQVTGKVLLFRSPRGQRKNIKINIHLLFDTIPLIEVKNNQRFPSELIDAPCQCELITGAYYCVDCKCDGAEFQPDVKPEKSLFQWNNDPDYSYNFKLILPPDSSTVSIALREDSSPEVVWKYSWDLNDVEAVAPQKVDAGNVLPASYKLLIESDKTVKDKLFSLRCDFIKRVSPAVLDEICDRLLNEGVLAEAEHEDLASKNRRVRAAQLVDTVRKKGSKASRRFIQIFDEKDPVLFGDLLQTSQA